MALGKKTGGRSAGIPNKVSGKKRNKTTVEEFQRRWPELNPLDELAKIAAESDTTKAERIQCHKELSRYLAPQLKAMDINFERDEERLAKLEAML